jgi:prevent-host-death family protein
MKPINVYDAKTQLSRLLERVEAGEEIVIARAGKPVARLVPLPPARRRTPGSWAGRWQLAEDWDSAAVNEQIADLFEASTLIPTRDSDES